MFVSLLTPFSLIDHLSLYQNSEDSITLRKPEDRNTCYYHPLYSINKIVNNYSNIVEVTDDKGYLKLYFKSELEVRFICNGTSLYAYNDNRRRKEKNYYYKVDIVIISSIAMVQLQSSDTIYRYCKRNFVHNKNDKIFSFNLSKSNKAIFAKKNYKLENGSVLLDDEYIGDYDQV